MRIRIVRCLQFSTPNSHRQLADPFRPLSFLFQRGTATQAPIPRPLPWRPAVPLRAAPLKPHQFHSQLSFHYQVIIAFLFLYDLRILC
jgi:hypothetical protein